MLAAGVLVTTGFAGEKYTGPKPPKPDLPYLLHGSKLVATETADAKEDKRGKDTVYTIPGATSTARTPLPEPIFIMDAETLAPARMELYKVESSNGGRDVLLTGKRKPGDAGPRHMTVFPEGGKLYRIEADEELEDGEYCLSPSESNRVFCFAVY